MEVEVPSQYLSKLGIGKRFLLPTRSWPYARREFGDNVLCMTVGNWHDSEARSFNVVIIDGKYTGQLLLIPDNVEVIECSPS